MVGCFAIDATDKLRAERVPQIIELTSRRTDIAVGTPQYHVAVNGSDLKYGMWMPLTPKKIHVEVVLSPGAGNRTFTLKQASGGFIGTYRDIGDVLVGSEPEIPVSLRRVPCAKR